MLIRDLLTERVSSTLYHYTSLWAGMRILETGQIQLSSVVGTTIESELAPPGYPYFISATRTVTGSYHDYVGSSGVMLVLDGDWFNQRYPGRAVDYWRNRDPAQTHHRAHEAEDRIFSTRPVISTDGIQSVHVLIKPEADRQQRARARRLMIAAKRRSIAAYLYDDERAWRRLDTRHTVSVRELQGQGDDRGYTSRHRGYLMPWMELIFGRNRAALSKRAQELLYSLKYHDQVPQGLVTDLHNARKPESGPDRSHATKIIQLMRQQRLTDVGQLANWIRRRWEPKTDTVAENFADGKVKEMAPPPISIKSATLYHGTPTLNNAQGIIRNGLKFDPELIAQKYQRSEDFAPLPGVYLSKDFGNAVRYSFMSEVPDDQYAEYIKQEPYGYVFEFLGQDLSQTSPDEDELGQLLEKFVKAKNLPPKLSALIQSIPENLKSQLSHPDVSFETIAVAGKWFVSKLKPQTLQYLMQRYINVVNYSIMKPVAVWKIPKPEQRFLRDRQGTFDTYNGYINWANRYGKKQPLEENFADGRNPGRKGLSRRVGIPKKSTLAQLEKIAGSSTSERRRMAQWQLNMRRGRARKNK